MAIKDVFASARRGAYNHAKSTIEASGQYLCNNVKGAQKSGKQNIRVAQSVLQSEITLSTSTTAYQMQIKDNVYNVGASGLWPGEQGKRLKINDVFFTYRIAFYIRYVSPGSGTYQQILCTFPSGLFAGAGGSTIQSMYGLWTGASLRVVTNGEVLTPAEDLGKCLMVPQTQAPINAISGSMPFDQVDLDNDGYILTEPYWVLNGPNDNQFIISYPSDFSTYGVSGLTARLVMKWDGWLAQNCSSIMDNAPDKS